MDTFQTHGEALAAIAAFSRASWGGLPESVRAELERLDAEPSAVARVCWTAEALYAHRAENGIRNKAARELIGRLAGFADENGWQTLRGGRGLAIKRAMQRDNGEAGDWPAPEDDPEPLEQYAPAGAA